MTCRLEAVRTPPGEMLLQTAPQRATRRGTVFGSLFVIVVIGGILLNFWAFFAVMLVTVLIGSQEVSKLVAKEDDRALKLMTVIMGTLFYVLSVIFCKYSHVLQLILILTPLLIALFSKNYSFEKITVSCWTAMFFVALPCLLMMEMYDILRPPKPVAVYK